MINYFKKPIFFFCFLLTGFNLFPDNSESVFSLDLKKDAVISAVSIGVFSYGYVFMDADKKVINNLDKNDVNFIDRNLMYPRNEPLGDVRMVMMPLILGVTALTPMTFGGGSMWKEFDTWLTYGVMYMQAGLLTYGTRSFLGKSTGRYRPAHYFQDDGRTVLAHSFPSGTTSLAFMPATFLSVTFSAEYPDSPAKIPVIVCSYTAAAIVGAMSFFNGSHFFTDVLAGAAIGSFYGWLVPTLHKRTNDRISFIFTGNGGIVSVKI